jgi:hypothetical protein
MRGIAFIRDPNFASPSFSYAEHPKRLVSQFRKLDHRRRWQVGQSVESGGSQFQKAE